MRCGADNKAVHQPVAVYSDSRGSPGQREKSCLGKLELVVVRDLQARPGPAHRASTYLISQQCFSKLQMVSFQDGGPMELGQWVLGSEGKGEEEEQIGYQCGNGQGQVEVINSPVTSSLCRQRD